MFERKGSLTSFNAFVGIIVFIPSVFLLCTFWAELNSVCSMDSSNVVYYVIILSCVSLLSAMTILKELMTFE